MRKVSEMSYRGSIALLLVAKQLTSTVATSDQEFQIHANNKKNLDNRTFKI